MVLEILEVEDDVATVDTDGDGEADSEESRQAYGVTDQELHAFGTRYQPGQTLWRTRNSHFSDWDSNWNLFPPLDAISPAAALAALNALGMLGGESKACGSIIGCENQTLGESLRRSGTPFGLPYQSERTLGRKDTRQVSIRHDAVNRTLYLGDGRARAAAALSDQITPVAGPGTTGVPDQSDASRRSSMRAVSGSSKSTRITPLDIMGDLTAAPGDFSAVRESGGDTRLETLGMAEYYFEDGDGNPLNVAEGETAEVELPIPAELDASPGDVIPAWHFDTKTGHWIEDGEGEVMDDELTGLGNFNSGGAVGVNSEMYNVDTGALSWNEAIQGAGQTLTGDLAFQLSTVCGMAVRTMRFEGSFTTEVIDAVTYTSSLQCVGLTTSASALGQTSTGIATLEIDGEPVSSAASSSAYYVPDTGQLATLVTEQDGIMFGLTVEGTAFGTQEISHVWASDPASGCFYEATGVPELTLEEDDASGLDSGPLEGSFTAQLSSSSSDCTEPLSASGTFMAALCAE